MVKETVLTVRVAEDDRLLAQEALVAIRHDLLQCGVSVESVQSAGPKGSKSGIGAVVGLAVTGGLAGASVRAIQQVLIAYLRRAEARRVELTIGSDTIVLVGASEREQREALQAWLDGHSAG